MAFADCSTTWGNIMEVDEKDVLAMAWASGLVEIGPRKRHGTCVICRGKPEAVW